MLCVSSKYIIRRCVCGTAGHKQIIAILRSAGATITNPELGSRLCSLACAGDLAALKDIDAEGGNLGCSDYDGRTALHLAASEGQVAVLEWLLGRGVHFGPKDRFGGRPVDDATRENHEDCKAILLANGATLSTNSTTDITLNSSK